METKFFERRSHRYLRCHTYHIDICNLRQKWNCAAGPRIHFNNKHLVAYNDELYVKQPLHMESDGEALRIVDDCIDHTRRKRLRRIDRNAVA